MPVYDYECRKCQKQFTLILRLAEMIKAKGVRCPKCGSHEVRKLVEPFFAVTSRKS